MSGFYDAGPNGIWVFLLVTVIMGGSTAYVSGRAIAASWQPLGLALVYAGLMGLAVRFIHFALFQEILLSSRNYAVDCAVLIVATTIGFRLTRRWQMESQYGVLMTGEAAADAAPHN